MNSNDYIKKKKQEKKRPDSSNLLSVIVHKELNQSRMSIDWFLAFVISSEREKNE